MTWPRKQWQVKWSPAVRCGETSRGVWNSWDDWDFHKVPIKLRLLAGFQHSHTARTQPCPAQPCCWFYSLQMKETRPPGLCLHKPPANYGANFIVCSGVFWYAGHDPSLAQDLTLNIFTLYHCTVILVFYVLKPQTFYGTRIESKKNAKRRCKNISAVVKNIFVLISQDPRIWNIWQDKMKVALTTTNMTVPAINLILSRWRGKFRGKKFEFPQNMEPS